MSPTERFATVRGGITVRGTQVLDEPRVHLIGFGPSQSTVGANRAGRDAVSKLVRYLRKSTKILVAE